MTLQPVETLLAALLVLLLGRGVNRLVPLLSRYNIPEPITGGLLFASVMTLSAWRLLREEKKLPSERAHVPAGSGTGAGRTGAGA